MALAQAAAAQSGRNPAAIKKTVAALTAAFGNRVVTSQAVREQHGNTMTWITNQPPDAVVYPQGTEDVQQVVRICAENGVAIIPFGVGTSLEGHVNAPVGGVSIDFRDMNKVLVVHAEDLGSCAIADYSFPLIPAPTLRSAAWRRHDVQEPMRCATAP